MEDKFNNIDQFFKKEFNDFSPEIPVGMWEGIHQKLAENQKKKVLPLYFRIAAGAAIFISLSTGAGFLIWSTSNNNAIISSKPNNLEITKNSSEKIVAASIIGQTNNYNQTGHESKKPMSILFNKSKNSEKNIQNSTAYSSVKGNSIAPEQNAGSNSDSIKMIAPTQATNFSYVNENISIASNIGNEFRDSDKNALISKDTVKIEEATPTKIENELADISQFDFVEVDEINELAHASKWSVGGEGGPQYTYRNITSGYSTSSVAESNKAETGVIAYAGGVNIEYQPSRRFTIQSGIYYSKMGVGQPATRDKVEINNFATANNVGSNNSNVVVVYSFPNSSVEFEGSDLETTVTADNKNLGGKFYENSTRIPEKENSVTENVSSWRYFDYVEFPVIARFILLDRKIGMHLLGGLSTNILMKKSVHVDSQNSAPSGVEVSNANKLNYSSTVGFGFGYNLSKQIKFTLEPQFKYYLSQQQYSESSFAVHPYSFGVMTGVKYIF